MGFDNQMEQNLGLYAYMYTSPFFFSKAVLLQIFCFLVLLLSRNDRCVLNTSIKPSRNYKMFKITVSCK